MTLKSLEAKLRRLPEPEIPKTLEARLLDAIPDRDPNVSRDHHQVKRHPRAWNLGAAATAAVLILALMLTVNYGLSTPPQMLLIELNDALPHYARPDQNNFLYDQNNAYVEKTLPYQLNWPMINPNEFVH